MITSSQAAKQDFELVCNVARNGITRDHVVIASAASSGADGEDADQLAGTVIMQTSTNQRLLKKKLML